ncbi:MAG: N-acetyltransferase family protein [Flavobacteriaceae bacterium]|nr:N-acetyltransferase family protein [Flavobacteriaceae bacterium]
MIRDFQLDDIEQLVRIYNYYINNTVITFDRIPFTVDDFKQKIKSIYKKYPFIIFEENNEILGFAYGSSWRAKPSYKHTAESTIYLKNGVLGKGIGTKLYTELLQQLKQQKFHTIIGGLTLPNGASIKLHEKLGFKKAAHFKEVGRKFDQWYDVAFWQLTL